MEYVNLRDICKINMGQSPESTSYNSDKQGVPFYQGNADFGALYPNPRIWCSKPIKLAKENDILISVRAPVGALNFSKEECCIGRGLAAITLVSNDFLIEFIYWSLRRGVKELQSKSTGSTFKSINKKVLEEVKIPKISLKDQKDIIKNITLLTNILTKYEQEIVFLDELVKARFVEMFGKYEASVKLSRYIKELRAGKSLAGKTKCKNKVLKTGAATFGFFDKEQYKYYPVEYVPNPLHKVEDGDVIISRMNTPELVGSCSYVFEAPDDMYYPDRLWKTIITEDTNPIFLWQLMWQQDIRKQIKENSFGTSGTMNNISKVKLLNIKAIDVPLELQNQFASFVQEIDKSRSRIQKSLEASQELFDSLMQEYFG